MKLSALVNKSLVSLSCGIEDALGLPGCHKGGGRSGILQALAVVSVALHSGNLLVL